MFGVEGLLFRNFSFHSEFQWKCAEVFKFPVQVKSSCVGKEAAVYIPEMNRYQQHTFSFGNFAKSENETQGKEWNAFHQTEVISGRPTL